MADVLVIGPHPDDVEIGCGGLVALLAAQGHSVAIADLTRGELATRGTPELRAEEAASAARILGAESRRNLDLGDGTLELNAANRDAPVALIREVVASYPGLSRQELL